MERLIAHVHIMKTAGQTICDILRRSLPGRHCDLRCGEIATLRDIAFARWFYPQLVSVAGHSLRPHGRLAQEPGLDFYTILREPIGRSLSHYQFLAQRNSRLPDFVTWMRRSANYQTRFLCGTPSSDAAIETLERRLTFVGLLEEFPASLLMWRSWSGLDLRLQHRGRNFAHDNSLRDTIAANPAWMECAAEANQLDLKVYRYVRDTIFPRQQAAYAGSLADDLVEWNKADDVAQRPGQPSSFAPFAARGRELRWDHARRGLLYKPAAKLRHAWLAATQLAATRLAATRLGGSPASPSSADDEPEGERPR